MLDAEAPRAAGSLSDRADLEMLNAEAPRAAGSLSDRAGLERLDAEAPRAAEPLINGCAGLDRLDAGVEAAEPPVDSLHARKSYHADPVCEGTTKRGFDDS